MDINVEKFQKDLKRFCEFYHDCNDCPLKLVPTGCYTLNHLTETIPVVQKWAEEHPAKTYLMDFKEKFPNCKFDDVAGCFCLKNYYGENVGLNPCDYTNCEDCWNREME